MAVKVISHDAETQQRPMVDRNLASIYHVSYVFRQGSDKDLKEFIPKDRH